MSTIERTFVDPSDISGVMKAQQSVANAITARAGGGQALATALTARANRITVCATIADSVKLPLATVGARVTVFNKGAQSCNVFPQTGQFINALAVNTAYALAATKGAEFFCMVAGTWDTILTA
jgi:hypothetical protein